MSPLFACFPVCLTFVGIGILAVLVFITGMVGPTEASTNEKTRAAPLADGITGPPPWWVVVLIFIAVAATFLALLWISID